MSDQGFVLSQVDESSGRVDALIAGRREVAGSFFGDTAVSAAHMYEHPEDYPAFCSGPWAVDMEGMGTTLEVDGTEYSWSPPAPGDPLYYG